MHLRHIVASHIVICDCHIVLFCAGCTLLPAGCTHCHVPWPHDLAAHGRKWPLNLLPAESARGGWCDWIRMHVGIGRSEQYSVCVCVWCMACIRSTGGHLANRFGSIIVVRNFAPSHDRHDHHIACGVVCASIRFVYISYALRFFIFFFHFFSSSWSSVLCILFAHWHWCSNGLAVHHHHHHRHYNGCCRCCRCRHTASSSSSIIRPPLISVMGNEEHARDLQHILQ